MQVLKPKYRVEECLSEIKECLEIGWTGMGYKTVEFEEQWCAYAGCKYAHFLNSATAGLDLAIRGLCSKYDWDAGTEILTTPLTFVSTNHAILYSGFTPVFVDVDLTLSMCPEDFERKITPKTRAAIFVAIGGNPGNYNEIKRICAKNDIIFILDGAHCSGTFLNDEHLGAEDLIAVYSFQSVKNLPTCDAGMITTTDTELADKFRRLSWLGINKDTYSRSNLRKGSYSWDYDVTELGYKYHGNSISAAIALVQLRYLEEDNDYRRQLAATYTKYLSNVDKVTLIEEPEHSKNSRHLFQILIESREEVIQRLYENNIFPGVHYKINTNYKIYEKYDYKSCPNAQKINDMLLSLPMHLDVCESDVKTVCEIIQQTL
jgi:dTDP-4-amino-4,6-dideoxygalactose transaminase